MPHNLCTSKACLSVVDECSKLTDLSVYFNLPGFKNLQTSFKHQGHYQMSTIFLALSCVKMPLLLCSHHQILGI